MWGFRAVWGLNVYMEVLSMHSPNIYGTEFLIIATPRDPGGL